MLAFRYTIGVVILRQCCCVRYNAFIWLKWPCINYASILRMMAFVGIMSCFVRVVRNRVLLVRTGDEAVLYSTRLFSVVW